MDVALLIDAALSVYSSCKRRDSPNDGKNAFEFAVDVFIAMYAGKVVAAPVDGTLAEVSVTVDPACFVTATLVPGMKTHSKPIICPPETERLEPDNASLFVPFVDATA